MSFKERQAALDGHVSDWAVRYAQFSELVCDVEKECGKGINQDQLLGLAKALEATPDEILNLRMSAVSEKSYINTDKFYAFVKLRFDGRPINLTLVVEAVGLIKAFNELITERVGVMFDELNHSTEDNRFHKAICLRRDICRLKALIRGGYGPTAVNVDWSAITPQEDYVDSLVTFDFLEEDCSWYLDTKKGPLNWFTGVDYPWQVNRCIELRQAFLNRLDVFG